MTTRGGLTEAQYQLLLPHLPPVKPRCGRPNFEHFSIINAIFWILRTGCPWRDLPAIFPPWSTVYSRFRRWTQQGVWTRLLEVLQSIQYENDGIDWENHYVDSTVCRAHRHAAGTQRSQQTPLQSAQKQALGRSMGGFSTKIHPLVEGKGRVMSLRATPGQAGDAPECIPLLKQVKVKNRRGGRPCQKPKRLITDKRYIYKIIRD